MRKHARLFLALFTFWFSITGSIDAGERWSVYENCRLLENDFNDGDSFHVRCGRTHRIFRLYFVDAPETARDYPARIKEQADYFKITEREALAIGKAASRFSKKFLSSGFTVYTRKEDARGNSKIKRCFAMISVGNKRLSEELVQRGLARIYGMQTDLPDGFPARKFRSDLKVIERAAQRGKKGAWGMQAK